MNAATHGRRTGSAPQPVEDSSPTFNDTLYSIYEATLSPGHWQPALQKIAGLSDSHGAVVYARSPEGWIVAAHSPRLDDAIAAYAQEDWGPRNPWLTAPVGFQAGDVYRDQDVLPDDRIRSDPFYTQFLARFGLGWQMAAVIHSELGAPTALVVQRGDEVGPFRQDEMDRLQVVSRHLEQSLRISTRFAETKAAHATVAGAFEALDKPTIILDRERRPLMVNRSARALMDDYFSSGDGRLRPVLAHEEDAFSAAVCGAHATEGETAGAPRPTTVSDARGERRLVLWSLPLVGASAGHLGITQPDRHVLLTAHPLEQGSQIDPVVIRSIFGLTLGEARLAALLTAGRSLKEAAGTLGITEGTARIVLKRAFQKLGVRRQAELVSKLTALAKLSH